MERTLKTEELETELEEPIYPSEYGHLLWAYLDNRVAEVAEIEKNLDTWDPYLGGFFDGIKAGLMMAQGLIESYSEWSARGIFDPDGK